MLVSQAGPPPLYYNSVSHWGNSLLALLLPCTAELRLHGALVWAHRVRSERNLEGAGRSSPCFSSGRRKQSTTLFVVPLPNCDMQTGTLGEGGLARELAVAAFLCCKRKHVYPCICVCMDLDGERRWSNDFLLPHRPINIPLEVFN